MSTCLSSVALLLKAFYRNVMSRRKSDCRAILQSLHSLMLSPCICLCNVNAELRTFEEGDNSQPTHSEHTITTIPRTQKRRNPAILSGDFVGCLLTPMFSWVCTRMYWQGWTNDITTALTTYIVSSNLHQYRWLCLISYDWIYICVAHVTWESIKIISVFF